MEFMEYFIGFVASFVATLIFALLLFIILKPRIKISDNIACLNKGKENEFYKFKFYNNSYFKAFDIKFELLSCKEYEAQKNSEGVNVSMNDITLSNSQILFIEKYRKDKKNRYAHNCVTVRVENENLENVVSKANSYLEFRVTMKHGFSNLSGTFTKKYRTAKCIKNGDFEFGNNFNIS